MNTNDIKQKLVNYLEKSSNHTFIYTDGYKSKILVKVFKKEDKFFIFTSKLENILEGNGFKATEIDLDRLISYYDSQSKQALKYKLFFHYKAESIRISKAMKSIISDFMENKLEYAK